MFFIYILKSEKDKTYYYGSTEDISKRVEYHNSGKVRNTKGHIPYKFHYSETFPTRSDAMVREKFFKSIDGYNWLKTKGVI